MQLMDVVMLYFWLRPKLESGLCGEMMEHLDKLFVQGRAGRKHLGIEI